MLQAKQTAQCKASLVRNHAVYDNYSQDARYSSGD